MDEAGFSLHPKLGLVWAKKGTQPKVPTASSHKRLNLAGWVAPWVGWHGLLRIEKGNKFSFIEFLRYLHHRLRDFTVFLYVDGATWHKGQLVQDELDRYKHIRLEILPPYHPELNPQERVWRLLRYEVTTNRYFQAVDAIQEAIRKKQRQLKPNRIRSLCQVT